MSHTADGVVAAARDGAESAAAADAAAILPVMSADTCRLLYSLLAAMHELLTGLHLSQPITYWLSGGTLLGLARHGGLIPSVHQARTYPDACFPPCATMAHSSFAWRLCLLYQMGR